MDSATRAAMDEALDDEYKARATYRKVIETCGAIRPFINIVESEGRHISALCSLYDTFGLTPPDDPWAGNVAAPSSLAEACRAAVEGEIENAEMYERLLANVSDPDVVHVLERLQAASRDNHLPAFRRCLAREEDGGGGPGPDAGRGRGRGRGRRFRGGTGKGRQSG